MNKTGLVGMRCHQALSFAPPMMAIPRREAIFWPGCALMQLDPAVLTKTAEVLRRAEPDLGLSSCCCGQPTRYLLKGAYPARRDALTALLEQRGVRRVYAACPNCVKQLGELGCVETRPIWSALAAYIRPEDIAGGVRAVALHDPCPMRGQPEEQSALRVLLHVAGTEITEPAHNRENTLCCGNVQMLRARDPEKSARLRRLRCGEFSPDLPVTSCCEGCLDAFRSEGLSTLHLLEVLFGKSETRGWGNRLAYTRLAKREASHVYPDHF